MFDIILILGLMVFIGIVLFIPVSLFIYVVTLIKLKRLKDLKTNIPKKNCSVFINYSFIKMFYIFTVSFKDFSDRNFSIHFIDSEEDYINLLQNKIVENVLVLGHGSRHRLKFKSKILYYCDLPQLKHIRFYGQLHCSHDGGKSAYEIIKCDGYDSGDTITTFYLYKHIKNCFDILKL